MGYEIQRKKSVYAKADRASMLSVLKHAVKNGLYVNTVIDVGAADGTPELYESFPSAQHILLEPLIEFQEALERYVKQISRVEYIQAAAWSESGEIMINVHPDLVGSSIYLESEGQLVNGKPRSVPAITLDSMVEKKKLGGPFLLKIDTQGSELDVLKGAKRVLEKTEMILIESSFFEFFENGPSFQDCIDFMASNGFVVYDIFGFQYRPLDGALSQVDLAFVRDHSSLRVKHIYATKEQRSALNEILRKQAEKRIEV